MRDDNETEKRVTGNPKPETRNPKLETQCRIHLFSYFLINASTHQRINASTHFEFGIWSLSLSVVFNDTVKQIGCEA